MEKENREDVKSFEELGVCEPLVEALEGKDIIGFAQTGSAKTGAFALPIIQALLDSIQHPPFFGCVLSPTRELAIQIAEQFEALGADIGLRTAVIGL